MKKIRRLRHGDLQITIFPKNGAKIGKRTGKRKRRQTGGFLSRYDFAYAGRDVVNQVGKVSPALLIKLLQTLIKLLKRELIRPSELKV